MLLTIFTALGVYISGIRLWHVLRCWMIGTGYIANPSGDDEHYLLCVFWPIAALIFLLAAMSDRLFGIRCAGASDLDTARELAKRPFSLDTLPRPSETISLPPMPVSKRRTRNPTRVKH